MGEKLGPKEQETLDYFLEIYRSAGAIIDGVHTAWTPDQVGGIDVRILRRDKRMPQVKSLVLKGLVQPNEEDAFELTEAGKALL